LPKGFARSAPARIAPVPAVSAAASPAPAPKAEPARPASPSPAPAPAARGATMVTDSFRLPLPPERMWDLLQDLPLVASCLPGAELVDYAGGDHVRGRVAVKFGPVNAAFEGEADVTREEAARKAIVRGGGRDRGSGSRAAGTLTYVVSPEADGGSRVDLSIEFALTGALAQFGRSSLVKAFVARLVAAFAENLSARLQGQPAEAHPAKLDLGRTALGIVTGWIRALLAGLFRRK